MTACPFCDPTESPLAETAHAFAIGDKHPISRGHCLIVPRRHVSSIFVLDDNEYKECFALVRSLKALLETRHHPAGFNLAVNDGIAAGQSVQHAHIHIVPRYPDDTLRPNRLHQFLPGPGRDL
jgi:diadenosine tetraphosphate (Ap4A) HIT family hydrolase